jgi:hypothetical protein
MFFWNEFVQKPPTRTYTKVDSDDDEIRSLQTTGPESIEMLKSANDFILHLKLFSWHSFRNPTAISYHLQVEIEWVKTLNFDNKLLNIVYVQLEGKMGYLYIFKEIMTRLLVLSKYACTEFT